MHDKQRRPSCWGVCSAHSLDMQPRKEVYTHVLVGLIFTATLARGWHSCIPGNSLNACTAVLTYVSDDSPLRCMCVRRESWVSPRRRRLT